MPLKRLPAWDTQLLHRFLQERATTPFSWGVNDCSMFAADAVKAQTGIDIAEDFRGKYTDKAKALSLIKQITGGSTVADAASYCATKHGLTELQHPLMAQRGDLVTFSNADGEIVAGIVHLNGRDLVSVGESGPVRVSIRKVNRAWRLS